MAAEPVRQAVAEALTAHLASTFDSFETLTLAVKADNRRLQDVNTANLGFTGDATFLGNDVTQQDLWTVQKAFLSIYQLPDGDVQIVAVDGTPRPGDPVPVTADGTVRDGDALESGASSDQFSAYGFLVVGLAGLTVTATAVGIYYIRRTGQNSLDRYKAYESTPPDMYELDPEDSTIAPSVLGAKSMLQVDTSTCAVIHHSATASLSPDSVYVESENDDDDEEEEEESSDDSDDPELDSLSAAGRSVDQLTEGREPSFQQSMITSALESVVEEDSHDVAAETSSVTDLSNLNVSVNPDADPEFVAVSAANKEQDSSMDTSASIKSVSSRSYIDPKTYSRWVGPLLRSFIKGRSGSAMNAVDTSLPDDLMVTDTELAEQRKQMEEQNMLKQMEVQNASLFDETASEALNFPAAFPDDESDQTPDEVPMDESVEDKLMLSACKSPVTLDPPAFYSRSLVTGNTSQGPSEESSSINLSQQVSFLTDDTDQVGADLLDKALRDVISYHRNEAQDDVAAAYSAMDPPAYLLREEEEEEEEEDIVEKEGIPATVQL